MSLYTRAVFAAIFGSALLPLVATAQQSPPASAQDRTVAIDRILTLTFTLGADGRATALVMRQNGNERVLAKVR